MKLSILVASRDMESKVDQFFESVYGSADESKFQCIVVDSSTDGTMAKLETWKSKHSNLQVAHYSHQVKCGTARNIACKMATGEYVYCMDIDDHFCSRDTLSRVLAALEADNDPKDIYYCPFMTARAEQVAYMPAEDIATLATAAVGVWNKLYKRELYVDFPEYMPEDVAAHYLLVDKCKKVGSFRFPVYFYDDTSATGISRSYDYFSAVPHNLLQLAMTSEIEDTHMRQEYIVGVLHNLADMFDLRDKLKQPEVKSAWARKLRAEYASLASGFIAH